MNDAMADRPPIFLSTEARGDIRLRMGTAHYSYGIVAERFARMLSRMGYSLNIVGMPERYKRIADLHAQFGTGTARPLHLCFRSTENMRPMPAATNVCHFAWEFDRLADRNLASDPVTSNQRHMLSLMDEIWVP